MDCKRTAEMIITHTASAYIAALLFGAPIFSLVNETLTFSVILGVLCSLPLLWFCGTKYLHIIDLFATSKNQKPERLAKCIVSLTIFGAWIGSIVIPLDWEVWWQAWPISNCISMLTFAVIGWICSFTLFKQWPSLLPFSNRQRL